jgi:hypothetical protein
MDHRCASKVARAAALGIRVLKHRKAADDEGVIPARFSRTRST